MSRPDADSLRKILCACALLATMLPLGAHADDDDDDDNRFIPNLSDDPRCVDGPSPIYSVVEFDVIDIVKGVVPVRAVMTQPVRWQWIRTRNDRGRWVRRGCFMAVEDAPAVVLLHDSGGKGAAEAFHTRALQQLFTTLAPEMFAPPTPDGFTRPDLPLFNYSYAMGALNFLADAEGPIGSDGRVQEDGEIVAGQPYKLKVDPDAVGCMGFSWGGVICSQVAVESYANAFGVGLYGKPYQFAAHVAMYPVCWARNISLFPANPMLPPDPDTNPLVRVPGSLFGSAELGPDPLVPGATGALTLAPLLVQVGEYDNYDNDSDSESPSDRSGSQSCLELRSNLEPHERRVVKVRVLEGAKHGFDRVYSLPFIGADPFGQLGTEFFNFLENPPKPPPMVELAADLQAATKARGRAKRFFYQHLY